MRFRIAAAIPAALLLAGCGSTTATPPPATSTTTQTSTAAPVPDPVLGAAVLGESGTLDWCSVADTDATSGFGASSDLFVAGFVGCNYNITAYDGASLSLTVGTPQFHAMEAPGIPAVKQPKGMRIVSAAESPNHCEKHLVFQDGERIGVQGLAVMGGFTAGACSPVDAELAHIVDLVLSGTAFPHVEVPAGSVRALKACDLVPPDAVTALPGVRTAAPEARNYGHTCSWRGATAVHDETLLADFTLTLDTDPGATLAADPTVTTVDGRTFYTTADPGNCLVQTTIRDTGESMVEVAEVRVYPELSEGPTACEQASEILRRSLAGLPKS